VELHLYSPSTVQVCRGTAGVQRDSWCAEGQLFIISHRTAGQLFVILHRTAGQLFVILHTTVGQLFVILYRTAGQLFVILHRTAGQLSELRSGTEWRVLKSHGTVFAVRRWALAVYIACKIVCS
jgi:hypothetical protein